MSLPSLSASSPHLCLLVPYFFLFFCLYLSSRGCLSLIQSVSFCIFFSFMYLPPFSLALYLSSPSLLFLSPFLFRFLLSLSSFYETVRLSVFAKNSHKDVDLFMLSGIGSNNNNGVLLHEQTTMNCRMPRRRRFSRSSNLRSTAADITIGRLMNEAVEEAAAKEEEEEDMVEEVLVVIDIINWNRRLLFKSTRRRRHNSAARLDLSRSIYSGRGGICMSVARWQRMVGRLFRKWSPRGGRRSFDSRCMLGYCSTMSTGHNLFSGNVRLHRPTTACKSKVEKLNLLSFDDMQLRKTVLQLRWECDIMYEDGTKSTNTRLGLNGIQRWVTNCNWWRQLKAQRTQLSLNFLIVSAGSRM